MPLTGGGSEVPLTGGGSEVPLTGGGSEVAGSGGGGRAGREEAVQAAARAREAAAGGLLVGSVHIRDLKEALGENITWWQIKVALIHHDRLLLMGP